MTLVSTTKILYKFEGKQSTKSDGIRNTSIPIAITPMVPVDHTISSWNTRTQMSITFKDQISIFANLKNPFTITLITGILLFVIVVTVVLYKLHRRIQVNSREDIRKKPNCMYCSQLTNTEHGEDGHKFCNHVSSPVNTTDYETIEIPSDDSVSKNETTEISCPNSRQQTPICQSKKYLDEDVDLDNYLCPISVHTNEKPVLEDERDDGYLTVV